MRSTQLVIGRLSGGDATRAALALAVAMTLSMSACSAAKDDPTISVPVALPASSPSSSSAAERSAAVASPALAELELTDFDRVNKLTIERTPHPGGRAFIDGLVAARFAKAAMEVTEDRTTIGLAAPSVQFSVLRRGICLIGQYGPDSGGYHAMAGPPVSGKCLIGKTRPIDW